MKKIALFGSTGIIEDQNIFKASSMKEIANAVAIKGVKKIFIFFNVSAMASKKNDPPKPQIAKFFKTQPK